ncbi:BON domain-containing protein [Thermodesulfobacteriota bacterium]
MIDKLKMTASDVYMTVGIAKITNKPIDEVVDEYKANKDKGWGVIAKRLGIKSGSKEFHALKKGGSVELEKVKGKDKDKSKGKDKQVKILDISTYCYDGNVYLVGEYENPIQKRQALKLAKGVEGVKSVTGHFLPKRKGDLCGATDNLELIARVKAKLIKDEDIWSTNIEVKALQCHILLLGLVGSRNQISKAITHAKKVDGVRRVKSYLKSVK